MICHCNFLQFQLEQDRKGTAMSPEHDDEKPDTWWNRNQARIWNLFECPDTSTAAKFYGFVSLVFVILSIFSFVASTTELFAPIKILQNGGISTALNESDSSINRTDMPNIVSTEKYITIGYKHPHLHIIDILCVVFFTFEYVTRVVFAPSKLKFVSSIMGVIDLIALLPDYIELLVSVIQPDLLIDETGMDFVSIFRIVRVLRIFRLIKHVPGLWILVYTLKASVGELVLLTCFMSVGILVFSSLIYFADTRENFSSIPQAFWWALITMTTVGYGDMYPTTVMGKMVGSICAMSGLLMIGFSVPALVNNFMLYYKHVQFALQAEREARREKEEKEGEEEQTTSGGKGPALEKDFSWPSDTNGLSKIDIEEQKNNNDVMKESMPLITIQNPHGRMEVLDENA